MKNKTLSKKAVKVALVLVLGVGLIIPLTATRSSADENDKTEVEKAGTLNKDEMSGCVGYISREIYYKNLVEKNIITQEEADKLIDSEEKIEKLYEGMEFDKLTEAEFDELMKKEDEIFASVYDIHQKIYFETTYGGFEEEGILSKEELETLRTSEKKISDLYRDISSLSDKEWEELMKKEEEIHNENKEIYDKVNKYLESQCEVFPEEEFESLEDLVEQKVITQEEADKVREVESKIENLYKNSDVESMTESEIEELDKKGNELYGEIDDIYQKIDFANQYGELEKSGVLSSEEMSKLREVEAEISKLFKNKFDFGFDDEKFDKLLEKEKQLRSENKELYDKVDAYFEEQYAKEQEEEYQKMIEDGFLTKEQVDKLRAADKEVSKLYKNLGDNPTEEEMEELDKKIREIYKDLDFLNYPGNLEVVPYIVPSTE